MRDSSSVPRPDADVAIRRFHRTGPMLVTMLVTSLAIFIGMSGLSGCGDGEPGNDPAPDGGLSFPVMGRRPRRIDNAGPAFEKARAAIVRTAPFPDDLHRHRPVH